MSVDFVREVVMPQIEKRYAGTMKHLGGEQLPKDFLRLQALIDIVNKALDGGLISHAAKPDIAVWLLRIVSGYQPRGDCHPLGKAEIIAVVNRLNGT